MNTGHAAGLSARPRHQPIGPRIQLLSPLAAALLMLLLVGPVAAHAELVSSDPQDGAVLDTPPPSVTLTFSEGLNASRSKFQLLASDGSLIGTGTAAADGDETMTLGGLDLGPGKYLIKWTSVSVDTDVERGELRFTVTEANPTPPPTAGPTTGPSPSPSTPAVTAEPSGPTIEPIAVPASAEPSVVPVDAGQPASGSGGLGDALLPIVAVLVLVAGLGIYLRRRNQSA